jgi:hypothetical protein
MKKSIPNFLWNVKGFQIIKTVSKDNKTNLSLVAHACNPGSLGRGSRFMASPGK